LPLRREAGDHLPAVQARLDDLQRHLALDGLGLLGHEDGAHAALADLLQQLVRPNHRAGTFADDQFLEGGGRGTQAGGAIQVGSPFLGRPPFQGCQEDRVHAALVLVHVGSR
jgi:hypothetical protein